VSLARAIASGDLAELPSRRDEDWRWTDLRGLIRKLPPAAPRFVGKPPPGPFPHAEQVLVIDGRGPDEIQIEAGADAKIVLRFISTGEGAYAGKVRLIASAGARLTLLESYEALGDGGYMAELDLDLVVGRGATVERIVVTSDAADAVLVSHAEVTLGPGSQFSQTVLAGGARRQRLETRLHHPGEGASVRLDAVYLLADQRHADVTTVVRHAGAGGATDQLAKGVVSDQARAVFQGRITVEAGADQTDAKMGHHALILSDRAEVDAKPELEIFADDVACAHGSTVGALDEDALFYAMQRGVCEAEARAMLTDAFVGEVIDRIEDEAARERAHAWATQQLRGAS
jgi:Fe-S cluster assembly protein SufD